jgi:hypothetical protein
MLAVIILAATGCTKTKTLYRFVAFPTSLPVGQTNLLGNPSFERPFHFCTTDCVGAWSSEHTTVGAPQFYTATTGHVTGQLAETISYQGRNGDDGKIKRLDRDVELYQGVMRSDATVAGRTLTFTLWVSGYCTRCAPFIGIEAFDVHGAWLGEQDQYFRVPKTPMPVRVSWVLPSGTTAAAAYIQVPEIYRSTKFDIHVDNALLVSRRATAQELATAAKHPKGSG